MSRHLGALTVKTFSSPLGHVLVHRGPDDLGADGLARALHAGMPEAVYGVENRSAESQRNEWPGRAIADVDYQAGVPNVDALEI